jgi:hypothetical protein
VNRNWDIVVPEAGVCVNESVEIDPLSLTLGKSMGRREAYGLVVGRSSAAEIESLRRLREEKLYRKLNCTWAEFCKRHLRVHRRTVDRAISCLEEFGPVFFHVTRLIHINAREYRSIADHVNEAGLHLDEEVIALLPEHAPQLSAAVDELLQRIEPTEHKAASPSFDAALHRCRSIAEMLQALSLDLDDRQKDDLAAAVREIRAAAAALGAVVAA